MCFLLCMLHRFCVWRLLINSKEIQKYYTFKIIEMFSEYFVDKPFRENILKF